MSKSDEFIRVTRELRRRREEHEQRRDLVRAIGERINYPINSHAVGALLAEGIETEEQLLELTESDLHAIPNLGPVLVTHLLTLQKLLREDSKVHNVLLQGLKDIAELVSDAPADNDLASQVKNVVNQILRDYNG
jgi:DNA-directed RNA polymerase alpha subunit